MKAPFSSVDGEVEEGVGYSLLASYYNSIHSPVRLTTRQCLDFLLAEGELANRLFGYGIGFDVCHWIADLSDRQKRLLAERGRCYTQQGIRFYRLIYRPGAYFTVQLLAGMPNTKNGGRAVQSATVVDLMKWFRKPFHAVCEEWGIGSEASRSLIASGKSRRGALSGRELLEYNNAELDACVELAERIAGRFTELGLPFCHPLTIGTVAGNLAATNRIQDHWTAPPPEAEGPIATAFFGGREQCARYGYFPETVQWDIRSAYGWALTQIPSLANAHWERFGVPSNDSWQLLRVSWEIDESAHPVMPFPFRDAEGRVHYPPKGTGWYWGPLVDTALRHYGDADIAILDWWTVTPNWDDKPFAYVGNLFEKRLEAGDDPSQGLIKMLIVATWGRLCSPGLRQAITRGMLDWAGMVTSFIQARMIDAIHATGEREFISCCVDGFWTTSKASLPTGDQMGQWKRGEPNELLLLRPTFYWKREELEWIGYTSGVPGGSKLAEEALAHWKATGMRTRTMVVTRRQCKGLLACSQEGDFGQLGQFLDASYSVPFHPGWFVSGHECPTQKSGSDQWRRWLPYWPPTARREAESAPFVSRTGMVDTRWGEKEAANAIEETMD